MRTAFVGLALLLAACDGVRVLSNGEHGELWAEVKVANGVQLLGPLSANTPSTLMLSRWEQTTDEGGRRSERLPWISNIPDVRFEPASVAVSSDLVVSGQGSFLTLTLTPGSSGVGTLFVEGEALTDRWALSFE